MKSGNPLSRLHFYLMGRMSFTMVELLTVISIIAIFTCILLPALNMARAKTRQISCLNNLRQLGIAANMYSDDNNDYIIAWRTGETAECYFHIRLAPYLNVPCYPVHNYGVTSFLCPEDKDPNFSCWLKLSYAINTWTGVISGGAITVPFKKRSSCRTPSRIALLGDNRSSGSIYFSSRSGLGIRHLKGGYNLLCIGGNASMKNYADIPVTTE